MSELLLSVLPLFADRGAAGRALATELEREGGDATVLVGLARGGVKVAAEVARSLGAPLDTVAVRKVRHPWRSEYAIGAVTPGDRAYVRGSDGLTDEQLAAAVEAAKARADALDERIHGAIEPLDLAGKTVLLVDDGLATGATMIAAIRWARAEGAARVVVAVPVAATESLDAVRAEADAAVCPHAISPFLAVGVWYASFSQVDDDSVLQLLAENRERVAGGTG